MVTMVTHQGFLDHLNVPKDCILESDGRRLAHQLENLNLGNLCNTEISRVVIAVTR